VVEKGSTNGNITDGDGKFMLTVGNNAVLQISYIGYVAQEIVVGNRTTFDITLVEDTQVLDEVVVVGYGTQKKVNLTGSITNIKTAELTNIATPNLSNTLAGRAPGVNITGNSGLVGASSDVRIRGGFGEPLYVIDGIIRDKDAFDALEANEVEQLSFLKDAATASVYGSQAGNGVVLVTTKSGSTNSKPVFTYQGSYTIMSPTQELLTNKITATDELNYQNNVIINRNLINGTNLAIPNGADEYEYFKNRTYNVNDWIWQNPWNTKHSLSVEGGNDRIQYYSLISYIGEEGSYVTLGDEKYNIRSNVSAKITDYIKMNLNISANQKNDRRFNWPFAGADLGADAKTVADLYRCTFNWPRTYPFYLDAQGNPSDVVTEYPLEVPVGSWNMWNVVDQVIGDRYIKTRTRELNAILSLDISLEKFVKGLSTKFVANYTGNDLMRKNYLTFQNNYTFISKDPSGNRFIPAAPDPTKRSVFTFNNTQEYLRYNINSLYSEQLDWFLNYHNTFGLHDVTAALIWEQAANGGELVQSQAENPMTHYDQMFVYPTDRTMRATTASEVNGGRLSWIGRANYIYAQKYIAEFSFRYDGNSLFPKEKRWGFFPSFSAAWRMSEEAFMKDVDWLNNLKLRGSYGTTGNAVTVNNSIFRSLYGTIRVDQNINQQIQPFSYIESYVPADSYIFGTTQSLGITTGATPNTQLTWATSTTYNGGIDVTVLDNHLSASVDVFKRIESDILSSRIVSLPDNYGRDLAPENYAKRSWKGIELTASWQDKAMGGRLNYSIYGNLGYTVDRWDILDQQATYLPGGGLEDLSAVGRSINVLTGFKTLGMIRTQADLDRVYAENGAGFTQWGRKPYIGGLYFEDIRGDGYSKGPDGKIDDNDIQLLSDNAAPRMDFGFGANLSYNNFILDIHFQGVGKYDRMLGTSGGGGGVHAGGFPQYGGTVRPYFPIWAIDTWTPDNTDAKYPAAIGSSWYESGTGSQSFWIRNGAYLRLKNLNLGYNLPKSITSKLGLLSAQLFFNGTNLFVISPMTELQDPEQNTYDSYPLMRSFTIGLVVKF